MLQYFWSSMGMTHSTSGKRGFEFHYTPTDFWIPRDVMIKILKLEDQLRFSPEVRLAGPGLALLQQSSLSVELLTVPCIS